MDVYEYAEHDICYRLDGTTLIEQRDESFYPVRVRDVPSWEGVVWRCTTAQDVAFYAAPDESSAAVTVPAGTAVEPVEASPSGWLHMRTADGVDGYLHFGDGYGLYADAAGNDLSDAFDVEEDDSAAPGGAVADAARFSPRPKSLLPTRLPRRRPKSPLLTPQPRPKSPRLPRRHCRHRPRPRRRWPRLSPCRTATTRFGRPTRTSTATAAWSA